MFPKGLLPEVPEAAVVEPNRLPDGGAEDVAEPKSPPEPAVEVDGRNEVGGLLLPESAMSRPLIALSFVIVGIWCQTDPNTVTERQSAG